MFMEQEILNICKAYTSEKVVIELLGISHNIVYKIKCSHSFILRISSISHRSKEDLFAEIDFLLFLNNQGANVNIPIPSLSQEIITEHTMQNEKYYVIAFTIAIGLNWRERDDDDSRLEYIGRELGKIHRISRNYKPTAGILRRSYSQNQHLTKGFDVFKQFDNTLYCSFIDFLDKLTYLSHGENYGLTHGDFFFSNYNITSDNRVVVFDFDECEFSWYISDIAVCLYYYLIGGNPAELHSKKDEAVNSLIALVSGYLQENDLSLIELKQIDLFFKLRDYILLSTIIGREEKELNFWDKGIVEGALERIRDDKPFIDIDFDKIIDRINHCSL